MTLDLALLHLGVQKCLARDTQLDTCMMGVNGSDHAYNAPRVHVHIAYSEGQWPSGITICKAAVSAVNIEIDH